MSEPERPLVLVVDDELAMRDLLCEILAGEGFQTVTASDGDEVVPLAQELQPSLILLDMMMPRMDGYTTMTRLQGHPLTAHVPVIVLTGHGDPVYRSLSQGVGAVAHVTKPFSPTELAETVRRALTRPRSAAREEPA